MQRGYAFPFIWLSFSMFYVYSKAVCILWVCLFLQGVNPWIEVDGGVGPKNAYKVSNLVYSSFDEHIKLSMDRHIRNEEYKQEEK